MSLTKCRIKDLGTVLTGNTPPTSQRKYYGNLYPLIKPTDMKIDERYIGYTQESLSEEGCKLFENKLLPKNTPCVVTIGTIGKLCLTKEPSFCNQAVNSIIVDQRFHDPMYIFYLMKISIPKVKFLSSGTASGRENVSKSAFESIEIEVPPFSAQKKIASILSNYDDLIENNTRRIEILEQMAKLIYEEWFIKFRFLGHENVKMVPSELGEIPEGWKICSIKEITALIKRGVAPKYEESSNDIVINQKCIRNFRLSLEESRGHISKVPQEKHLAKGDILINSTGVGTLGRVAQVLEDLPNCTVDTHVTIVRPEKDLDFNFFGLQIFRLQSYFESQGRGATGQAELGRDTIEETKVIVAPKEIQDRFSSLVNSLRDLAIKLNKNNQNLRKTRDLLLPKLISGELDVSDLDIRIRNEFQES